MIALPIILIAISLIGIKLSRFHNNYIDFDQTTSVKGIFAIVIVMSHMWGFGAFPTDTPDLEIYRNIINYVGQLMVTMFFFYSGYGITVSAAKKTGYMDGFFKNRIFKVLLHFDIALIFFVLINRWLGIEYSQLQYLTCWFGWGSIGNSNWFIFDTLIFYLITYVALGIKEATKTGIKIFACVVSILCLFFFAIMYILYADFGDAGVHWYNTIMCFPAGVWYGAMKDKIDAYAKKWYLWWPTLAVIVSAFLYLYSFRYYYHYYAVMAPVFCILFTWVTMKIRVNNPILRWLGKHSFEIYIIQRIPMIIIRHYGLNTNQYVFTALVVVSTLLCAWAFALLLKLADKLIFKKKKA